MPAPDDDPGSAPTIDTGELAALTLARDSPRPAVDPAHLPFVGREHYAVEGEFARGGMGRILSARDRRLGRAVALKELQAATAAASRRFVREASSPRGCSTPRSSRSTRRAAGRTAGPSTR